MAERRGTAQADWKARNAAREDPWMPMVQRESVEGRGSAAKEMREIQVESSAFTGSDSTRAAFRRPVSWMMNLGHVG